MRIILGLCAFAVAGILIWQLEVIPPIALIVLVVVLLVIALFFPKQSTEFLLKIGVGAKTKNDGN